MGLYIWLLFYIKLGLEEHPSTQYKKINQFSWSVRKSVCVCVHGVGGLKIGTPHLVNTNTCFIFNFFCDW